MIFLVGKSKGNKQVNKNAAKEESTDSNKKKKMTKARGELGGGLPFVSVVPSFKRRIGICGPFEPCCEDKVFSTSYFGTNFKK